MIQFKLNIKMKSTFIFLLYSTIKNTVNFDEEKNRILRQFQNSRLIEKKDFDSMRV